MTVLGGLVLFFIALIPVLLPAAVSATIRAIGKARDNS